MRNGAAGVPRGVIVLLGLASAVVAVAGLKTVSDMNVTFLEIHSVPPSGPDVITGAEVPEPLEAR